jgi:hypothetical protein
MTMDKLWLLKFSWPRAASANPVAGLLRQPGGQRIWRSTESELGYAYFSQAPTAKQQAGTTPGSEWIELACTLEMPGASAGAVATHHYIVETDVLPVQEDDFNAWYNEEHLPGLASVHGTIRAARYLDVTGSPRYYACYDLASLATFRSPAWLPHSATAWSSRVRPGFRNTRRTMFHLEP